MFPLIMDSVALRNIAHVSKEAMPATFSEGIEIAKYKNLRVSIQKDYLIFKHRKNIIIVSR